MAADERAVALACSSPPEIAMTASPPLQIGEADLVVSLVRGRLRRAGASPADQDIVYSEEAVETDADAAARIVFLDGTELPWDHHHAWFSIATYTTRIPGRARWRCGW